MSSQAPSPAFALAAPLGQKSNTLQVHQRAYKSQVHPARAVRKLANGRLHGVQKVSVATVSGASLPADEPPKGNSFSAAERDSMLLDDDDRAFAKWAAAAERGDSDIIADDDETLQLESLLEMDPESGGGVAGLEDDELIMELGFGDEDDEDDNDDGDDINGDEDEDEEEEEEEDAELASRASGDDEENDDIHIDSVSERESPMSSSPRLGVGGVESDSEDDVDDEEEVLEPIAEDIGPIFGEDVREATEEADLQEESVSEDPDAEDDAFGDESEEEIQSAANILSSSGLLGLGVEGGKRADVSAVTSFVMGDEGFPEDRTATIIPESAEDEPLALELEDEEEDDEDVDDLEDDTAEKGGGLDSYVDSDESEEGGNGFTLTTQSSFGKVWELNDDNYVTITAPGESYVYELDEEDEEDQEMAIVRRGKQGGWSGGLASYSASKLPEGSKEWVARKAYELLAKSNQTEMFQWTRRHKKPPPVIDALYPPDPPAPPKLRRTKLKFSTPDSTKPIVATDSSASNDEERKSKQLGSIVATQKQHALERAVKFPCQYKFKVEGGEGDDLFEESLAADLEKVLGKAVDHSTFQVEPAGRYKRVVMMVDVASARQVTEVYDALRNNPSVKFSFG